MAPSTSAGLLALCASALPVAVEAQIKVMGMGIGRTGTQSLRTALEILGYKVFGDAELVWSPAARQLILKAEEAQDFEPVWRYLEENGYNATTGLDRHQFAFWKHYGGSGAKAVLTVRSFEGFYRSFYRLLFWQARYMMDLGGIEQWNEHCRSQNPSFLYNVLIQPMFTTDYCNWCVYWHRPSVKLACKEQYEFNCDKRRTLVPADQRLEYDVRQAWGPLCGFLGVPEPPEPFPRKDSSTLETKEFKAWQRAFLRWQVVLFGAHFGAPCLLFALCARRGWLCCRRRRVVVKGD